MKTVRFNTFETNSSSMHALVIMPRDVFDKYDKGELILNQRVGMSWDEGAGFSVEDDAKKAPKLNLKAKDFLTVEEAYNKVINTNFGDKPKDNWQAHLWEEKTSIIKKLKEGGLKEFNNFIKKESWNLEYHFNLTTEHQMDENAKLVKSGKYYGKDVVKIYLVTEC